MITSTIRICRIGDIVVGDAFATAIHVAVNTVQADGDVVALSLSRSRSHLATGDGHLGQASRLVVVIKFRSVVCVFGLLVSLACSVGVLLSQAHGSHLAAAIHIKEHMAAADVDI